MNSKSSDDCIKVSSWLHVMPVRLSLISTNKRKHMTKLTGKLLSKLGMQIEAKGSELDLVCGNVLLLL